jgi:hypothetical protein
MKKGKGAIALLLGKPMGGKDDEDESEDMDASEDGESSAYFDEFVAAMKDDDNDGAREALKGFVRACKKDD